MKMNINEKRAYRIGYADGIKQSKKQAEKLNKQSKQNNTENLYINYLRWQNQTKNKEVNYGK